MKINYIKILLVFIIFLTLQVYSAEYNLTVGNGSGSGIYEEGSHIEISASVSGDNIHFLKWESDLVLPADTFNPVTFLIMPPANLKVNALFSNYSVLNSKFDTLLIPDDLTGSDEFGNSLDIDGSTAVISAHRNNAGAIQNGAVYVYEYIEGKWVQNTKLHSANPVNLDNFGSSVSISGNRIAVGASYMDSAGRDTGSVFIFDKMDNQWTQTAEIIPSDLEDGNLFGLNVKLTGDILFATASSKKGGKVYVYTLTSGTWVQQQVITPTNSVENDGFGQSVDIAGTTAVIGSYADNTKGISAGCIYIYKLKNNLWIQEQKITASDGSAYDLFGFAVSISGHTVAVGAKYDDDKGESSGSVYIFREENEDWHQAYKLTASNAKTNACFGASLNLSGDKLIVGSYGKTETETVSGNAYLFLNNNGIWSENEIILPENLPDNASFGYASCISGDFILSSAIFENNGTAYMYHISYFHTLKVENGSGSGIYSTGEKITVDAAQPEEGFYFTHWTTPQGNDIFEDPDSMQTTVTMPDSDVTVVPEYKKYSFNLTYNSETGGSIEGESAQNVEYGDSGSEVKAIPDEGYEFVQWSDGNTSPARLDENITSDLTFTAQFRLNTFSLKYNTGLYGHLEGELEQTVEFGHDAAPVTAVPDRAYHFLKWSDGSTDNPRQDTAISKDMDITAEFTMNALQTLTVKDGEGSGRYPTGYIVNLKAPEYLGRMVFKKWILSSGSGEIENPDSLAATYTMGNEDTAIAVEFETGYILTVINGTGSGAYLQGQSVEISASQSEDGVSKFYRWSGDTDFITAPSSPDTTVLINRDITIKAEYIPDNTGELPVTEGSIIYFKSEKFPRMDSEFSSAPKIKYSYTTNEGHETSVNQKTLTKINKNSKSDYCGTRWKGKVQLFDRKELKKALKQGVSTRDFLLQHPQKPLTLTYSVTALNSNKEECSTTRKVSLVPPEIITAETWSGIESATFKFGGIIVLKGKYFGTSSITASIEYKESGSGKIKQRRLKILKTRLYTNEEYSIMSDDEYSSSYGESEIWLELPADLKNPTGDIFDIILNNKNAIAVIRVKLIETSLPPVPAKDTFTIQAGLKKYSFDVLANDLTQDSGKVEIILDSTFSLYGAPLDVKNGKIIFTLPNNLIFPYSDHFYYSLRSSEQTSAEKAVVKVQIILPEISYISRWDGSFVETDAIHPDSILKIAGSNFGISPEVILTNASDVIKLKPQFPKYPDYKAQSSKSFTDIKTGDSELILRLPGNKKIQPGTYNICIKNTFGSSTNKTINIISLEKNTPPVAENDNITIFSGQDEYSLNVLANDSDAESDIITIKLQSKDSKLGGEISYDKKTMKIKYKRPSDVFSEFTDSFTYTIVDAQGLESTHATVIIHCVLNNN